MSAAPDDEADGGQPEGPAGDAAAQRLTRAGNAASGLGGRISHRVRTFGYRTSFYAWRLRGRFPQRILQMPPAIWHGDDERGRAILNGQFRYGSERLALRALDWQALPVSADMQAWLHSFDWLHDVVAASGRDGPLAGHAHQLVDGLIRRWLEAYARYDPLAWRPDVLGRRLFAWCINFPLLVAPADHIHRSTLLNALARSARHLARTARRAAPGMGLLAAHCGLVTACLSLPGSGLGLQRAADALGHILDRMVLPDGGLDTRSPAMLAEVLEWLNAILALCREAGEPPPAAFVRAVDRLVPALRGMLHADGSLAGFHGGVRLDPERIARALAATDVSSRPLINGQYSGYQRIDNTVSALIADCGPPPMEALSTAAHAGTLSFELSEAAGRIVVNCGAGRSDGSQLPAALRQSLRSTAAHSTLVLADTNSTQVRPDGALGRGVGEVTATRQENEDGCWITAAHDGYVARFGLAHMRKLYLRSDGFDLRGEDRLVPARKRSLFSGAMAEQPFDIRFHLDPQVDVTPTQGGQGALLRLPGGATWMFKARGATMTVTESIVIDEADQVRPTHQLVLSGKTGHQGAAVYWSFRRSPAKPSRS